MKNKLIDLNNHLFEQLERLNDESLKGDNLSEEMERAKAVSLVASQIIANANLSLQASKARAEHVAIPEMMGQSEPVKQIEKQTEPVKRYSLSYKGK